MPGPLANADEDQAMNLNRRLRWVGIGDLRQQPARWIGEWQRSCLHGTRRRHASNQQAPGAAGRSAVSGFLMTQKAPSRAGRFAQMASHCSGLWRRGCHRLTTCGASGSSRQGFRCCLDAADRCSGLASPALRRFADARFRILCRSAPSSPASAWRKMGSIASMAGAQS